VGVGPGAEAAVYSEPVQVAKAFNLNALPLSYGPWILAEVGPAGFEPATFPFDGCL
jgi:hypothetical protein